MFTDDDPIAFLKAVFSKRPPKEPARIEETDVSIQEILDCVAPSPKPHIGSLVSTRPVTEEDSKVFPLFGPRTQEFKRLLKFNSAQGLLQSGPFSLLDLPSEQCRPNGCGIYALYYQGNLVIYITIRSPESDRPLYIGKCEYDLYQRLSQHRLSIQQVGLKVEDFTYRYLVLDPFWIRSVEWTLIEEMYWPVWNKVVEGFGNRHYGLDSRANNSRPSPWDTLHPGREGTKDRKIPPRDLAEVEQVLEAGLEKSQAFFERTQALLGRASNG